MSRQFVKTLFLARQCEQFGLTRCARLHNTPYSLDDLRPFIPSHVKAIRNQIQCYSSSSRWRAKASTKESKESKEGGQKPQSRRMQEMMKEAQRYAPLPEEVGLLPGTFIMPTRNNLPSLTNNWRGRWLFEKRRMWEWLAQIVVTLQYRYFYVKPKPPRHKPKEIIETAEDLHKQMYEHFAADNLDPIEHRLFPGMMSNLRRRIAQRATGTQLKWTLHRRLSPSKMVYWRPMFLPEAKGELKTERKGAIQAVVRINSLQSLQHVRKKRVANRTIETFVDIHGRELASQDPNSEKHAKEVVEYVVLQKFIRNSREGPWKIWGTTEETTLRKLQSEQRKQAPKSAPATA